MGVYLAHCPLIDILTAAHHSLVACHLLTYGFLVIRVSANQMH